jgi:hypothetical protein
MLQSLLPLIGPIFLLLQEHGWWVQMQGQLLMCCWLMCQLLHLLLLPLLL